MFILNTIVPAELRFPRKAFYEKLSYSAIKNIVFYSAETRWGDSHQDPEHGRLLWSLWRGEVCHTLRQTISCRTSALWRAPIWPQLYDIQLFDLRLWRLLFVVSQLLTLSLGRLLADISCFIMFAFWRQFVDVCFWHQLFDVCFRQQLFLCLFDFCFPFLIKVLSGMK